MIRALKLSLMLACLTLGSAAAQPPASASIESSAVAQLDAAQNLDYRLGAGDQLRVIVFGEPDLSGQYTVGAQGKVSFPLVGDVQAAGLTLGGFLETLQDSLSKGFLKQPKVSAEVLNYRPFFILGEVAKPGTYPYSANLTVQNAVATAGGFTYRADVKKVIVKHASDDKEHSYRLTSTMVVQPGDTVRIPERLF
jgi:protein involved in polysaccharide export with SLBB domain